MDVNELQRRLGILLAPAEAANARWSQPLPAGHAATWRAITAGTTLEGAAFVASSGGVSGVMW